MGKLKAVKPSKGIYVLALALAIASLGTGLALANGAAERSRQVLSGGASDATAAGGVSLQATLGQPMVGPSGQGSYKLCTGFWCGLAEEHDVYLPLIMRSFS
jgi:hypothetical protein